MRKTSVKRLISSMKSEIRRSMAQLKSPGHPRPYFMSYLTTEQHTINIWARYGALCGDKAGKRRFCYADVRVGSPRYDQIRCGGLLDNDDEAESVDLLELPLEDKEDAIRFCLWRLTDARYREAVKDYHSRKARDVSYLDQNRKLASFTKQEPVTDHCRLREMKVDREEIRALVKGTSLLLKKYPEIKNAYVDFRAEQATKLFTSSEGVERSWQTGHFQLSVYMWFLSEKGNEEHTINYSVGSLDELPTRTQLARDIKERVELLYRLEKATPLTSFAGPVLLAPGPAGLFLHEVVGHRLEGCRLLSDEEGRTFKDKVGQQVMHQDISITDDPTQFKYDDKSLIGSYVFDDEGIAGERTVLVERGVLKGFLTSRSPIKSKDHQSNGHARHQSFERPISRMANFIVEGHSQLSFGQLKQRLLAEIKSGKYEFGLILYEVEGGETGTEAYNFQAFLGEITHAVKLYADGREELVKGVDFVGTPLSCLNNIVSVGGDHAVDNSYCGAESGSIPVSTVAPSLLISNLELQAKDPSKVTQYQLPLPWFDQRP